MEKGLKILVVDDEMMIRDAVSAYLIKMGCTVYQAENGKDALSLFEKEHPDFVILDLMLPGMSGEDICLQIRKQSSVPVIMLTAKAQEESVLNGLKIGADDYVTKPFSVKELFARMETIMRRVSGVQDKELNHVSATQDKEDEKFLFKGELFVDVVQREVIKKENLINLTKSEWKILISMVKHPKKVFAREELMEIVFGEDSNSFDRVIDTHIKNLRKKIEDDPKKPEYILTVHGLGYKFGAIW